MTPDVDRSGHGLLRNSAAIVTASNLAALLGYLYWLACAHGLPPNEVGVLSTCTSAILAVGLAVTSGFVPLLIRSLATADLEELSGLGGTALVLVAALGVVGGIVVGLLLPATVRAAVGTAALCAVLAVGSAGSALLLVLTATQVGVRRADLAFVGNTAASSARLVLVLPVLGIGFLPVSALLTSRAVLANLVIWAVSFLASVPLCVWLLRRAVPGFRLRPGVRWLPRLWRGHGWEYLITFGAQSPIFLLPVLAAALVPADQVAFLYMVLMVANAFTSLAGATSTALLSDCAGTPDRLVRQSVRALLTTLALLLVPGVLTCLFATEFLSVFGEEYAHHGSQLLVLLVLASLPDVFVAVGVSVLRLRGHLSSAAALNLAMGVGVLWLSWYLLPRVGVTGTGWSFLATNVVGMTVVIAVAYRTRFRRVLRPRPSVHDLPEPTGNRILPKEG